MFVSKLDFKEVKCVGEAKIFRHILTAFCIAVHIAIIVIIVLTIVALRQWNKDSKKYYDIGDELNWVDLNNYDAVENEYLGKIDTNFTRAYSIEGLSQDNFLYREKVSFMGQNGAVIMRAGTTEPIFDKTLAVKEIYFRENQKIDNPETINKILDALRGGDAVVLKRDETGKWSHPKTGEIISNNRIYVRFYFDIPSELSWSCRFLKTDSGRMYFIYNKEQTYFGDDSPFYKSYALDVTDILAQDSSFTAP